MKKFLSFAAMAALMACFVSCGSDDDEKDEPVVKTEISVSPSSVTFEAEGGSLNLAVTTNAASYAVGEAPAWLKVQQNGKELVLTADENTVAEQRTATIKLQAQEASASISVTQKAGSPYRGFTVASSCVLEYSGTMLYQFLKPAEGYDGGQGSLVLTDEDGNQMGLWIYTELFESADQVNLTPGTYTKGADDYPNLKLVAKKLTYMIGFNASDDPEDTYIMGCFYQDAATETMIPLVDGTIEVADDVVKAEMMDAAGNEYKFVFMGKAEIDAEGATYPSGNERIDVASTIFKAECYYGGDKYENGTTTYTLMLYSGTEDNYATTTFEFVGTAAEYAEDLDLSGTYIFAHEATEEEEELPEFSAGTLTPGSLLTFGDFSFPQGTFIMYGFGDYTIADAFASLVLEKAEDGTYSMNSAIMSEAGEMVMFFGINGLQIPVIIDNFEED